MEGKERSTEDREEQGERKLSARDRPLTCSLARRACKHWLDVFCGQRDRKRDLGKKARKRVKQVTERTRPFHLYYTYCLYA